MTQQQHADTPTRLSTSIRDELFRELGRMSCSPVEIKRAIEIGSPLVVTAMEHAAWMLPPTDPLDNARRLRGLALFTALFVHDRLEADRLGRLAEPIAPPTVRPFYVNYSVAATSLLITALSLAGHGAPAQACTFVLVAGLYLVDICRWIRERSDAQPSTQKRAADAC